MTRDDVETFMMYFWIVDNLFLRIELNDLFTAAGAKVYGMTSTEGYDHSESKAEVDGKFVGLMCDEDNQYDLSEDRSKSWIEQLKSEGFF